jgi:alpha-tubulin suppressor-like RCC1 family protein
VRILKCSLKCWGRNVWGDGLGDTIMRGDGPNEMGDNLPVVDLGTGETAIGVSMGAQHTCALLQSGHVKCWGTSHDGQLGLGDTGTRGDGPLEMGDYLPAVDLGTAVMPSAITGYEGRTCVIVNAGRMKCWGRNDYGQLGLGDTLNRGDDPGEMGDNLPFVGL